MLGGGVHTSAGLFCRMVSYSCVCQLCTRSASCGSVQKPGRTADKGGCCHLAWHAKWHCVAEQIENEFKYPLNRKESFMGRHKTLVPTLGVAVCAHGRGPVIVQSRRWQIRATIDNKER